MDAAQIWEAEAADIKAPCSVSVRGNSKKKSWCLAGKDNASIVFGSEVRATANICDLCCLSCHLLQPKPLLASY